MSDEVYTLGVWRMKDGRQMRGHPDAATEIGKLMDLCDEGRPGTFRVVATG